MKEGRKEKHQRKKGREDTRKKEGMKDEEMEEYEIMALI